MVVEHLAFVLQFVVVSLIMGGAMAVIMLSFMLNMYKNQKINLAIYGGAAIVFLLALWLVRSQATVGGLSYMRAMIPHHSIAVMTSGRQSASVSAQSPPWRMNRLPCCA